MATEIVFDATDIFQLGRQMSLAHPIVVAESKIAMERSAIIVTNAAKMNIQRQKAIDTGQLLNSIGYAKPVQPFVQKVGTNKTYASTVEFGRAEGATMPPAGALLGWMQRHGIPLSLEFVIRRAISRRGIRARPYLHPALEQNRVAIDREFVAADLRIARRLTA